MNDVSRVWIEVLRQFDCVVVDVWWLMVMLVMLVVVKMGVVKVREWDNNHRRMHSWHGWDGIISEWRASFWCTRIEIRCRFGEVVVAGCRWFRRKCVDGTILDEQPPRTPALHTCLGSEWSPSREHHFDVFGVKFDAGVVVVWWVIFRLCTGFTIHLTLHRLFLNNTTTTIPDDAHHGELVIRWCRWRCNARILNRTRIDDVGGGNLPAHEHFSLSITAPSHLDAVHHRGGWFRHADHDAVVVLLIGRKLMMLAV